MLGSERVRSWLKFLAAIAVSIAFFVFFILSIDVGEVADSLAGANYGYVAPGLALFAASVVFRALRWRVFLEPYHMLSTRQLLPSVLIGYAGNNLLPLRAGELVRAQSLAEHHQVPRMRTLGCLLMERLFDGLVLALLVLWGSLVVDVGDAYLGAAMLLAAGTAVGFIVCTIIANKPQLLSTLSGIKLPLLREGLRGKIGELGSSFFSGFAVLTNPGRFVLAIVSTVGAWSLELAMYWLIGRAFDLDATVLTIAFAGAAANVGLSVPLAQGGVGPFQILATEALTKAGVEKAAAAAYALALHFFLIVPVSLVGLVVLWRTALPSTRAEARPAPAAVDAD